MPSLMICLWYVFFCISHFVLCFLQNMDKTFSTNTKREQFADFNKSMATNKSNSAKVEPAPLEEPDGRPGVRIVRIPSNRDKDRTKTEEKGGKVRAAKKDEDDLELGDEASTIKKEGEKEEEEEPDKQIEVVDCFPLCCTTR